jgi:D-glycero-D-manno-heptose 1,7-bisphosphate phosphatase
MQPALFLDRDGVINVDHGYVHRPEDFHFMDGIFDVARAARTHGYRLVVVTNQAGIGRGRYGETQFHALTDWMCLRFGEERALIDRVYFPPYHPTAGLGEYKQDHVSRKPRPGMLFQAQRELGIDLAASILIWRQAQRRRGGHRCRSRQESPAAGGGWGCLPPCRICADRGAARSAAIPRRSWITEILN